MHHQAKWGFNMLYQKERQLKLGFYIHLECHTIALRAVLQLPIPSVFAEGEIGWRTQKGW